MAEESVVVNKIPASLRCYILTSISSRSAHRECVSEGVKAAPQAGF